MKTKTSVTASNPYTYKVALSFEEPIPDWKLKEGEKHTPFLLFHLPVTREQAIKFVDKSPFDPICFWDFIDEKNVSCDVKTLVDLNKEIFWNLERECVYCYGVREN